MSPLALHWNGASWSNLSGGLQGSLSSIGGVGNSDVWVVGSYFNQLVAAGQTLAERWTTTTWSVVPTPNATNRSNDLISVAGVATNDVWAVGSAEWDSLNYFPLIEHWNGSLWSIVSPVPDPPIGQAYLNSVTAIATNDVWAVGQNDGTHQTLIEHWDGTAWTTIPNTPAGKLYSVSGRSTNDVRAVGGTLTMHWNGSVWSVVPMPNAGDQLSSVAATLSGPAFAVGSNGSSPLLEQWDGTRWTRMLKPSIGTPTYGLGGIAAISSRDVWAVGGATFGTNPQTTLTLHYTRPLLRILC